LSQVSDFDSLKSSIKNAKANYTFELWADAKTKLISKVAFTDPSNKSSVFTLSQNYSSGNQYPFSLHITGKDSGGNPEDMTLGLSVDTKTNKSQITLSD